MTGPANPGRRLGERPVASTAAGHGEAIVTGPANPAEPGERPVLPASTAAGHGEAIVTGPANPGRRLG